MALFLCLPVCSNQQIARGFHFFNREYYGQRFACFGVCTRVQGLVVMRFSMSRNGKKHSIPIAHGLVFCRKPRMGHKGKKRFYVFRKDLFRTLRRMLLLFGVEVVQKQFDVLKVRLLCMHGQSALQTQIHEKLICGVLQAAAVPSGHFIVCFLLYVSQYGARPHVSHFGFLPYIHTCHVR